MKDHTSARRHSKMGHTRMKAGHDNELGSKRCNVVTDTVLRVAGREGARYLQSRAVRIRTPRAHDEGATTRAAALQPIYFRFHIGAGNCCLNRKIDGVSG